MKKGVFTNFAKFTRKYLCQTLFFNKVADLRPATFLKKRLWHRCFPVNFAKFGRTPFLQNTSGRLLLYIFKLLNWREKSFLINGEFSFQITVRISIKILNMSNIFDIFLCPQDKFEPFLRQIDIELDTIF